MKLSEFSACMRGDVFGTKLITASPRETLTSVALRMQEHNVGAVVIVEGHKPVGIVTDRDLGLSLALHGGNVVPEDPVRDVMTTPVRTIPEGAGVFAATQCLRDAGVRRLPIVDAEGRLVGIISMDDVVRLLGRELHNLGEGIKPTEAIKAGDLLRSVTQGGRAPAAQQ
jgi:CBS domain-containing protein